MNIEDIFREYAPADDREGYEKARFGHKMGFGKRPSVLVVDMTNEFVDPKFPLASGDLCIKAAHSIKELLKEARLRNIPVIYTRAIDKDIHVSVHGISRKSGTMPSKKSPIANEIYDVVAPKQGDVVIEKPKASPFFGTPLESILRNLDVDTLVITGATTSGCVRAAVVDAASYEYYVAVPIECVGDRAMISHKVSLMDMHNRYADVLTLKEVLAYLKQVKLLKTA